MANLLSQLTSQVHPQERSRCAVLAGLMCLASVGFTIGQGGSEALFIAKIGMKALPLAMVAASVLTVLGFAIYSCFLKRWSSGSYYLRLLLLVSGMLAITLPLLANHIVIYALFCLYYLCNAIIANQFWNWAYVCFDASAAKRIFPIFATASSVGGVLGGIIGSAVNGVWGPAALITCWSAFVLLTAGVYCLCRRQMQSWGAPLVSEDEDTSLPKIRLTINYIKNSPLSLWLTIAAIAMVLAQFIALYLYQSSVASAFPRAQDLAAFLNYYLIGSNILEICVEILILPLLLARLGIPRTNLIHPCTTLLALAGMLFCPGLVSAVATRVNGEVLESGLASPVRTLMYNALPTRFREQLRTFLEGIVTYGGMATAGLLLYFGQDSCSAQTLIFIAMGLSVLYLFANISSLRHYLASLIEDLRTGRLNWDNLDTPYCAWNAAKMTGIWHNLINEDPKSVPWAALHLTTLLGRHGAFEPLVRAGQHPSPRLRAYIAAALSGRAPDTTRNGQNSSTAPLAPSLDHNSDLVRGALIKLAHDSQPEVASQALDSLQTLLEHRAFDVASPENPLCNSEYDHGPAIPELDDLLGSPCPQVAARAASLCADRTAGEQLLNTMAASDDADKACSALNATNLAHLDRLKPALSSANSQVKTCALQRYLALVNTSPFGVAELCQMLDSSSKPAIEAALHALRILGGPQALQALTQALTSPKRHIRRASSLELLQMPPDALPAVRTLLSSDYTYVVNSAIETLGASAWPQAIPTLYEAMESAVVTLWQANLCLETLQSGAATPEGETSSCVLPEITRQRLIAALQDIVQAKLMFCDRLIAATSSMETARNLRQALRAYPSEAYGKALEILSNLGNRRASRWLVLFFEKAPLSTRLASLPSSVSIAPDSSGLVRLPEIKDIVTWAKDSPSRWLRLACVTDIDKDTPMDNLLLLRKIALFQDMTLEQLEAINTLLVPAQYLAGEVVFREGDFGTKLFLLTEGCVDAIKNYGTPQAVTLGTMQAVSYFGEMAIIDDAPRSATIKVRENANVLILDGANFKGLMHDMPDISMEVMRVLTARIRKLESLKYDKK